MANNHLPMKQIFFEHPDFLFSYNLEEGHWSLADSTHTLELSHAVAEARVAGTAGSLLLATDSKGIERTAVQREVEDTLGKAQEILVFHENYPGSFKLILRVRSYRHLPGLFLQVEVTNSKEAFRVYYARPFALHRTSGGEIALDGRKPHWSFFKHGYQSWSPSRCFVPGEKDETASWVPIVRRMTTHPSVQSPEPEGRFSSYTFGALEDRESGAGMLLGATTCQQWETLARAEFDQESGLPDFLGLQQEGERRPLEMGETFCGEWTVLLPGKDMEERLVQYAEISGMSMGARIPAAIPRIWCSWYHYFEKVTEADCFSQLDILAKQPGRYFDVIQLDDGYEAEVGSWLEANKKFPSGLDGWAKRVLESGFTPGIWTAPFLVSSRSKVAKEHPEWLLRDNDGKLVRGGINPRWGMSFIGVLDPTYPEVKYWLCEVFTALKQWGYRYFKLDFLYAASLQNCRFYDKKASRMSALREGLKVIREAVGEESLLEGCGCPLGPAVGLVDIMRTAPDVHTGWQPRAGSLLRDEGTWSTRLAVRSGMVRAFLNGSWWKNHVDCLMLRKINTNLTEAEADTLLTVVAMNGGGVIDSDDLGSLPSERWETLQALAPPLPMQARCLERFRRPFPEILWARFEGPIGLTYLASATNWAGEERAMSLPLDRFTREGASREFHAFSVWEKKYLGKFTGEVPLEPLPPHGSKLVVLRPVSEDPQILATHLHFSQGVAEVTRYEFDFGSGECVMELEFPGAHTARLLLSVSPILSLTKMKSSGGGLSLEALGNGLVQLTAPFQDRLVLELTFIH